MKKTDRKEVQRIEALAGVLYLKDLIWLSDNPVVLQPQSYPHKIDLTIACVCRKGALNGFINNRHVKATGPGLLVLLPEQILQFESISDDFEGTFIIMSRRFIEEINLPENFSAFMSIRSTPFQPITAEVMLAIDDFMRMVRRTLGNNAEGLNRKEIIRHLTIAFFYGLGYYLQNINATEKSRNEELLEKFIALVEIYHKHERSLDFYADKLYITSKYLSAVVKSASGKTGRQWINDYIILEAKTMMKTSDMTIQQVSAELNFPSQSFFGKYFKRETGMSPKEYRERS